MKPLKQEAVTVLVGKTSELEPVLFITGGPTGASSPFAALAHEFELLPGQSRRFTWALASLPQAEDSFKAARQTAARNWDAEITRIKMTNESQLQIETGDPDWDAAFALGRKTANSLIHGPTEHLPHPSYVATRDPDQGFSARGDGSDYNHLWNGQSALDARYLIDWFLPGDPQIAKGLLRNFLSTQTEEGFIDWKPGLAGQRSRLLSTPLLADMAWRIYLNTKDRDFLEESFNPLLDFFHAWFSKLQDRDGDGIPEWNHPNQSGFEDNPAFASWHAWAQGAEIAFFESPALCALLLRECQTLIEMARVLERREPIPTLEAFGDNLKTAIQNSWQARSASYYYWDRETHQSPKGELLGKRKGPGEISFNLVFDLPSRLLVKLEAESDTTINAQIFLHGALPNGQHVVEKIERDKIDWRPGSGTATIERLYGELEQVRVDGLPENGRVSVHLVDYRMQDLTLLLPLWAGAADEEQAEKIIARQLNNPKRYQRKFGLPAVPNQIKHEEAGILNSTWLPWAGLMGEALISSNARAEAADLVTRIMSGITGTLKREAAFRKHVHAYTGEGLGERDALAGLPPIALFLQALGIRIISPWKLAVNGFNPFPWPVKLQYRGLMLECTADEIVIVFPDGQAITIDDPTPCMIEIPEN
jgi:hypothetical protein